MTMTMSLGNTDFANTHSNCLTHVTYTHSDYLLHFELMASQVVPEIQLSLSPSSQLAPAFFSVVIRAMVMVEKEKEESY